jgi:ADP-dependent NAD(P)H-hydrate dehydratase / NAD(P)H-hydrate epimerase
MERLLLEAPAEIPKQKEIRVDAVFASDKDLKLASKPRSPFSSKHENGTVLIIAGSSNYHGAPVLASNAAYNTLAALRIGIGYALLYVPSSIENPVRKLSPSIIVRTFGRRNIGEGNFASIKEAIRRSDAIVIGMGIGREAKTLRMAARIIGYAKSIDKKIVIDADAIYALRHLERLNQNAIITPQDREFSQIYGSMPDKSSVQKRTRSAVSAAKKLNCCILLKGHNTIITDGKSVKVIKSKSSALATMGTGDVLSGIIGGYAAIGNRAFKAGVAGAYLHSRIGDILHNKKGNHLISNDLVEQIPAILKKFDK